MEPAARRWATRSLLSRLLLLSVAALAARLIYSAAVISGSGAAASAGRKTYSYSAASAAATVGSPAAWRSRQWRKAVDFYAAVFGDHLADGRLSLSSRAVCLGGQPTAALALRELGVAAAVAIGKKKSPPLVVTGAAYSSSDFVFVGESHDRIKRPSDIADEAARILKPDGYLVVLTSGAGDPYSLRSLQSLLPSLRLIRSREIDGPDSSTLREVVFQKLLGTSNSSSSGNFINNCAIREHKLRILGSAEPLIQEEPLKPWITLKRNLKNIKYLPELADIGFKRRYVYVDVGSRSYGSSIGSWFRKQYPKQNHTFEIFAIEADPAFHSEYAAKKGVTLLPFAAWVRNETLTFEINGDPGQNDEAKKGRGMGWIRPAAGASNRVSSGEVRRIPAFDFAEWLKHTVSEKDYVVMKMDVEGTEFDLLPRLFETGAICLIDELFLECHYNRWQKCCPGERSPKFQKTYGECLELFTSLRDSGILVHQWW